MNMEEIENYISELESMFELSELEEHSRNILKVGIYIKQLQQENQELKKQLEEYKLITIDYQELEARNQELKKQIEYLRRSIERKEEAITELECEIVPYTNEYVCKLENQQKEFIEWLTNEANINPYDISDYIYGNIIDAILSKYNEIIGSDSK